jgi:glycosyltransferase involved in cell wall biosynthesis
MKICCPTYWYPEYKDDIHATYVHDINRYLVKNGHEVIVVTPNFSDCKKNEIMDGVEVLRFDLKVSIDLTYGKVAQSKKKGLLSFINKIFAMSSYIVKNFIYTYKICKDNKIDVIHAHWAIPSGFSAVLVSKLLKIPCYITMHGGDVYYNPQEGYVFPKLWYIKPFLKYTLRQANKLTAITEDCKKHAINAGALEKDIVVITNGADLDRFVPMEKDIKLINKYGPSEHIIFTCRQLIPRKGVGFLIKAMPAILDRFSDAVLLIVGDGMERNELENSIEKLHLKNSVYILGWVANKDLPKFYNFCDVSVMPSLEEGFGIPAAEAMGCEKPVVATNAGGLIEVIEDGKTGIIVEKGSEQALSDGIIKIFTNKQMAKNMGIEGRIRAFNLFSWDKTVKNFIALYKS